MPQANDELNPPGFMRLYQALPPLPIDLTIALVVALVNAVKTTPSWKMEDLDRLAVRDIASTTETKPCDDIYHEDLSKKEEETRNASDSRQRLDSDNSSGFSDRADELSTTGDSDCLAFGVNVPTTNLDDLSKTEEETHNIW